MSIKRMLRSIVVLTLIAAFASTAGFAQTRTHDISLSYGLLSSGQLTDIFTDIMTVVITLGAFSKNNVKYSGVPFLTYHYSHNSKFGFGVAVGGYNSRGDLRVGETTVGDFSEKNYIGAVELDYHWVMRQHYQIYSGAGFGVRYHHGVYTTTSTDTANKVLPTFHVNLIGFRVGGKFGFFGEFGAGYKGVFSVGVNAQF
jgi:hypothetical protein